MSSHRDVLRQSGKHRIPYVNSLKDWNENLISYRTSVIPSERIQPTLWQKGLSFELVCLPFTFHDPVADCFFAAVTCVISSRLLTKSSTLVYYFETPEAYNTSEGRVLCKPAEWKTVSVWTDALPSLWLFGGCYWKLFGKWMIPLKAFDPPPEGRAVVRVSSQSLHFHGKLRIPLCMSARPDSLLGSLLVSHRVYKSMWREQT